MGKLERAVAFVLDSHSDRRVGLAFLIGDRVLLTCAHVVNAAIGRDTAETARPHRAAFLYLEFPLLGSESDRIVRPADVTQWLPVTGADFEPRDVAVLGLQEDVIGQGGVPLRISPDATVRRGGEVRMWGPGPGRGLGRNTVGVVRGESGKNRFQIDDPDRRVVPGFSGGPVCHSDSDEVVGMVQAVPRDRSAPDVYVLSNNLLYTAGEAAQQPVEVSRPVVKLLHDHGEVHYDGASYRLIQRRRLYNGSRTARRTYEFKVSVAFYPNDGVPQNVEHHSKHPLVPPARRDDPAGAIEVEAWFTLTKPGRGQSGSPRLGLRQPIAVRALKVADQQVDYKLYYPLDTPLEPGAEAVIEYCYRVTDRQWGQWYKRNIKADTEAISVEAHLPADLAPEAWGMNLPPSDNGLRPLPGVTVRTEHDKVVYAWTARADDEDLDEGRRVRLDWFFWKRIPESTRAENAADVLGQFGILQMRDPVRGSSLRTLPSVTQTLDLDLPADRDLATDVIRHLRRVAHWVGRFHDFKPQVSRGIAAPQLGIAYRIAIVSRPADGVTYDADLFRDGYLELVNPRIVEETIEEVTDYEGCLSFFDVRGQVRRPYGIRVAIDGRAEPRTFTGALARSISHEIDHLNGKIYTDSDRMPYGEQPVTVADYQRMREEDRIAPPVIPARLTWRPV
ncbi:peptide deformylase [Actinoplanes sp. G11-F43]|uniref:peptide deformylase n=1 Tax=Actinoplanes sp. G11-F43 TaxID=3424130 RepID=UPI003D338BC6